MNKEELKELINTLDSIISKMGPDDSLKLSIKDGETPFTITLNGSSKIINAELTKREIINYNIVEKL